jgi:hypothetical protein
MAKNEHLDAANAEVLADMIADPDTPDAKRVLMINKLLESRKSDTFFATMFTEKLSYGACPCCGHENHWLIPEDELNQIGEVTYKKDSRVLRETTMADCPRWQEACIKKKTSI